jgi:cytochrome c oxidase subunit 2
VLWSCSGIFVVVGGLLIYTFIRFRRRRADDAEPPQVYGSTQSELAWTVISLLTVFVFFLVTARTIKAMQDNHLHYEAITIGSIWRLVSRRQQRSPEEAYHEPKFMGR